MRKNNAQLTAGPLAELYKAATHYFIHQIDPEIHVRAYEGWHEDETFAETEFAGKYLDTCVRYAAETGSEEALEHAKMVVESIMKNQRCDGYLGGLTEGKELVWFSIWNQAFTLIGMLSYYDLTGDTAVLQSAERIGDFVSKLFLGGADINDSINDGSQHLSILLPMVRLYQATKKPLFRDFILHLIEKIKMSDNNFFDFESIMDLRSKKGIENFIILLGLLEYSEVFQDDAALAGCQKYWEELNTTQIRSNGNGTLVEFWTHQGNAPRILRVEDKPDENCVAVGWMEFTLALFSRTKEAKYLHALEQSLFNHLLGAADRDGRDFAYYQPNYGKRILATAENVYKCCRYRGYSMVSQLPDNLYWSEPDVLIPMIYAGSSMEDAWWNVQQKTDYPKAGSIVFQIQVKQSCVRELWLRLPPRSFATVLVDGIETEVPKKDGYLRLKCDWPSGDHEVQLVLTPILTGTYADIDGKQYISYQYGCLLLAAEVDEGMLEDLVVDPQNIATYEEAPQTVLAECRCGNTSIVDYASAGRTPGSEFTVWMRCKV